MLSAWHSPRVDSSRIGTEGPSFCEKSGVIGLDLKPLKSSARLVQEVLNSSGLEFEVVEFPASTRTAADAASAIGCTVAQIAKSIVFRGHKSARAILVIASGVHRIDENRIAAVLGEKLEKASAGFVREATGFAIGGVPPCGHPSPIVTFIDRHLLDLPVVWAAAGTPNAVFSLAPEDLVTITGGRVVDVA